MVDCAYTTVFPYITIAQGSISPDQPLAESGILNGGLLDGLEEKHWFTCLAVLDLLPAVFVLSRGVNVVVDC